MLTLATSQLAARQVKEVALEVEINEKFTKIRKFWQEFPRPSLSLLVWRCSKWLRLNYPSYILISQLFMTCYTFNYLLICPHFLVIYLVHCTALFHCWCVLIYYHFFPQYFNVASKRYVQVLCNFMRHTGAFSCVVSGPVCWRGGKEQL